MVCFTGRILRRMGFPEGGDESVLIGCTAVNRWWEREGRYLSHFRIRAAKRFPEDGWIRIIRADPPATG